MKDGEPMNKNKNHNRKKYFDIRNKQQRKVREFENWYWLKFSVFMIP